MISRSFSPDVPVLNSALTPSACQSILVSLREISANRIWIAFDRNSLFLKDRSQELGLLRENVAFFQKHGVEVGIWIQAFGFGDPVSYEEIPWTRLRSVTGKEREADAFCPEDPEFFAAYLSWVEDIVRCGASLLMLDDDLCLSVRPGIGCFCPRHMALMEKKLGKPIAAEGLAERIFTGGKNPLRDAWFEVMGDSMRGFCRKVRERVDTVDPTLRVGLCAGYTSWDIEGTDPIEMAKILAGENLPFFRFTGAPYWSSRNSNRFPGQRLNGVIECARNQMVWCENEDVEVFAEADSYPRPCYHVNASYIECFDVAMHAAGIRSLKYLFDYVSSPDYEKGYLRLHKRNMPFYEKLRSAFDSARYQGVRLYRPAHRICDARLPEEFHVEKSVMRGFFSIAASALTRMSIPVSYHGASENAALFGDDALYLEDPSSHRAILLDLPAARILQERGIDVGLRGEERASVPLRESFGEEKILLSGIGQGSLFPSENGFYRVELAPKASVLSLFSKGEECFPASYLYQNGETSFLVLCCDASCMGEGSSVLISYARQKQLLDFFGNDFPYIFGFSQVYALCAKTDEGQSVLFQNLSIDPIFDFSIQLPKPCGSFCLTGAEGELSSDGQSIRVTTDFTPYSSLLLQVTYE